MHRRASRLRLASFLLAILQLALPVFLSVADGRAEAESRGARSHVEAYGHTGCPRVHAEDCAVCRVLAASASAASGVSFHVPIARVIDQRADALDGVIHTARFAGDPPQRAPPVLS